MKEHKDMLYNNIIVEIGKYTVIPAILAFIIKIPGYDERIVFALFTILNWIFLTEFKVRGTKAKLDSISKELKKLRKKEK